MNKKFGDAGYTMVELLIVILVLSIAIGTLFAITANLYKFATDSQISNIAVDLAEQELERVTGLRYSSVASVGTTPYSGSLSNYSYAITVSAVPSALANDSGMVNYKMAEILVTHTPSGKRAKLTTMVTNTNV